MVPLQDVMIPPPVYYPESLYMNIGSINHMATFYRDKCVDLVNTCCEFQKGKKLGHKEGRLEFHHHCNPWDLYPWPHYTDC
jgi:hypothetical protein